MNTKYDVFISYSRNDMESDNHVSRILHTLEEAGIAYWYDQEGIEYGDDFVEKILDHIESAPIFIFLSSKNSNSSRFTSREVALADELRKYIIPVKLDSTPYNDKIMFRIVDIPPVRFNKNAEKALKELVVKIQKHLEAINIEEQKKEDEKRRQLEAEEAELLKEKNRRERKEQLARLREQHDKAKTAIEAAEVVVAEYQAQLKKAKESLETKERTLKEEQEKLSELETHLNSISPKIGYVVSDADSTRENHSSQHESDIPTSSIVTEKDDNNDADIANNKEDRDYASKQIIETHEKTKYKWMPSNPFLNDARMSRKILLGLFFFVCLLILCIWVKQRSSERDNITNADISVDSVSKCSSQNSELNMKIDEIIANLSTIRPQLKEYIDGYRNQNAEATFRLAKCFEKGDFLEGNRNSVLAGSLYHIAADAGYADAQTSLGFYFFYGRGGYALNYDSAVYWYSEAIRNGSIAAKYYLAKAYDDGRYTGTTQGKSKNSVAIDLYRSSAELGFAKSQVTLGFYFYDEKRDYLESKKWLEKALNSDKNLLDADTEKAKAEFYMGQLYGTGKLTIALNLRKDEVDKISFEWYKKAATTGKGYTEAMYYLGAYYQNARGTRQDLGKATEWYKKAANRGHQGAKEKLSGKAVNKPNARY